MDRKLILDPQASIMRCIYNHFNNDDCFYEARYSKGIKGCRGDVAIFCDHTYDITYYVWVNEFGGLECSFKMASNTITDVDYGEHITDFSYGFFRKEVWPFYRKVLALRGQAPSLVLERSFEAIYSDEYINGEKILFKYSERNEKEMSFLYGRIYVDNENRHYLERTLDVRGEKYCRRIEFHPFLMYSVRTYLKYPSDDVTLEEFVLDCHGVEVDRWKEDGHGNRIPDEAYERADKTEKALNDSRLPI